MGLHETVSSFIISCIERLQRIRGELDASDNAKSEGVGVRWVNKCIPLLRILSSCIHNEPQLKDIHRECESQAVNKTNNSKGIKHDQSNVRAE